MMLHHLSIKVCVNILVFISIMFAANSVAQHRGDNLTFQGLTTQNDPGVKATAMGAAVTSLLGDVSSVFYNPASLIGVNKLQVTVAGNNYSVSWKENQHYRPNRLFVTLPFYLEGLYIPDPAENGMFDYERVWTEDQQIDSSYVVALPDLGLDPYSDEAADWKVENSQFTFNNVAVALPLNFGDQNFVISAAYFRKYNVEDFDRNDTYLDPHIGYIGYGDMARVNGVDTLVVNWSRYERQRSGPIDNITAGLAYDVNKYINVGLGFQTNWGETNDIQSLQQIGTFDLIREQRFRFSYVDSYEEYKGISKFSSTSFNIGLIFNFNKVNVGLNVYLPYTVERDWNYTITSSDSNGTNTSQASGVDKLEIPAIFNFGVSFQPTSNFTAAIDYEYAPLSQAEFNLQVEDPTLRNYMDRHTLRVGLEYMPADFLSIMLGYRNIPATFVPDGAADVESGPDANSISGGLSFHTFIGRFDLAYEYRNLKYYDSYYSNTNYVTQTYSSLLFGFVYSL
jgi:opacity protein-like surface antigen